MNITKTLLPGLLTFAAILPAQTTKSIFPLQPPTLSTVSGNGDVNPYGVLIAPKTLIAGSGLQPGDVLVSNFNNSQNLQGTGTTILRVDAAGNRSTFFTAPAAQSGLTAAIGVLSDGVVLAGNLNTADGTSATASAGRLAVLDRYGDFLGTFGSAATIDGPWGMAVDDLGTNGTGLAHVFVSNILSGVVSRIDISYSTVSLGAADLVLANGFTHRADPAALELGPSGLAYSASNDTLYVASSSDNAIYAIANASKATATVTQTLLFQDPVHLHGPLGLALLPNGHLLIANSDGSNADPNQPSELAEFTTAGQFVGEMPLDSNNGGAFGLATLNMGWGTVRIGAVNDNKNTLNLWTTVLP